MAKIFGGIAIAVAWLPVVAFAAPKYSDWEPATHLGCVVNSAANDQGPAISKDGLSLYFSSNRPGGEGDQDIWLTRRASPDAPWGLPINLGEVVNTDRIEGIPSLSRDGHWLFFNSNRTGGFGDIDIWVSYRQHVHDDLAWETPANLGSGVNTAGFDAGAGYFENENGPPLLFFNRGESQANQTTTDIYVAALREDGSTTEAVLVPSLSSPQLDSRPSVRFDGLEVIFFSSRPDAQGTTDLDLWSSTRNSTDEDWSIPVRLSDNVNTTSAEANPYISPDGTTLFFASNRPLGCGGLDLYMTTRTKLKGNDE
jgi:Tol biopolymer transport system component